MIPEAWQDIIKRLIERTGAGELDWEENAFTRDQFDLSLAGQTIEVTQWEEDFNTGVQLRLRDDTGRSIEDFVAWDNQDEGHVRQLWEVVRRRTLRVDEALDQLRETLG